MASRRGLWKIARVPPVERVRGDRAEACDACMQAEPPAHLEPWNCPCVERGCSDLALTRNAPVRRSPELARCAATAARSESGERKCQPERGYATAHVHRRS